MMKTLLNTSIFIFCFFPLFAQHTVGLLSYEPDKSYDGYNLFFSHNQPNVYLIDNCGQVVHSWEDEAGFVPGNMVYLLENGQLVKCKRKFSSAVDDPIWAGGGGETVEIRDWDNQLIWSFEQNDSLRRLHHDIEPLPNGNILMISWELKTFDEAVEVGRDPTSLAKDNIWPDYILEMDPNADSIVWEWHVWDHLIQDIDSTKNNFGVVADHPERIDINYDTRNGNPDWLHSNAIDYNAELDQILLCVPAFNELWIIDHSTTTEEAAGTSGGKSGKGGDLLYRWGNPLAYQAGTTEDQQLFFQHDTHWLEDFVPEEDPLAGKIMIFNNRVGADYSSVNIITPPVNLTTGNYTFNDPAWGPSEPDRTITHPIPTQMHSTGLSNAQLLPNGNTLMLSGRWGYAFELTPENKIVWEYKIPFKAGARVAQGDTLNIGNNITFKLKRYPIAFPAFTGKDLNPKYYLELEPDTAFCNLILPVSSIPREEIKIYPNPASGQLIIEGLGNGEKQIRVYDQMGRLVEKTMELSNQKIMDTSQWRNGIYFIQVDGRRGRKVVVLH